MKKNKKLIAVVSVIALFCVIYKLRSGRKTVPISYALGISYVDGVISPDGQQSVATSFARETLNHVVVFSLSGKILLSRFDDDLLMYPSWSGDSKNLFFSRMDKTYDKFGHYDNNDICLMSVDKPTDERFKLKSIVKKPDFNLNHPVASADGIHLAYEQSPVNWRIRNNKTIWVRNLRTQQDTQLGSYRLYTFNHPTWSVDGNVVAFGGTQDASQEWQPPYREDEKNPAIRSGLVWASAKENFALHYFPAKFSDFKPNNDGSQFALIVGEDARGDQHVLEVFDANGNEIARIKRKAVSVSVAWNSTNTAIFFIDNHIGATDMQLCRWDIKTGEVTVLQPLSNLRGEILGYRHGTLFYSTVAGLKDEKNRQIIQLETE